MSYTSRDTFTTEGQRFAVPKSSVYYMHDGVPACGLPEKLSKRINQYSLEDRARANNEMLAARMTEKPSGQRWDAGGTYRAAVGERIAKEEARREAVGPQLPVFQTSRNNPLMHPYGAPAPPEGLRQQRGTVAPAPVPPPATATTRAEPAPMVPTNQAQMNKLQHTHLGLGSMNPTNFLQREKGDFQLRQKAHVQHNPQNADRVAAAREAEGRLIQEYPHGVPKYVLLKMQRQGVDLQSTGKTVYAVQKASM